MKINSTTVIVILITIIFLLVILIVYLRALRYNSLIDIECEEEHIINNKQKACCVKGKCKIKEI